MRRKIYVYFSLILFCVLLVGCGNLTMSKDLKDLKKITDDFSLDDAKGHSYVVMEDGDVTSGQEAWLNFVSSSEEGISSKVRIVHYYTIDDPSSYDPEYYESIKDEYPCMYISELVYNKGKYTISHFEDDVLYQTQYNFLMKYEGEPESEYATFKSYVRYVLVNDETVTWEDIRHGMFSSQFGDFVDHKQVYTDLVYKDE